MTPEELKEFQRQRARDELSLVLLKTIYNFKSQEEPEIDLTVKDKQKSVAHVPD